MSEKYFNAYVDAAVGSIHEYVALTLQLKAQLRVANELLAEKEKNSASSQSEIDAVINEKNSIIAALENQKQAEIEEVRRQMFALKNEKDIYISNLQNELASVRSDFQNVMNSNSQSAATLQNEVVNLRNQMKEIDVWKEKARIAEESVQGISNKVKHMDTLTKQYGELKAQFFEMSKKYDEAKARIEVLETEAKSPKKVINTKSSSTNKATVIKSKEPGTDDF